MVPLWVGLVWFFLVKIAFARNGQKLIKHPCVVEHHFLKCIHLGDSSNKLKSIKLSKYLCIVDIFPEKCRDVS